MISLIVPVYNVEPYLKRCIVSIFAQTYREFELILVDDGSTDGSSIICDFYEKQDKRVKVIHKGNGGLVSARRAGLAVSRGEYIGFVDGDDWIEPQMYGKLVEAALKYQADMVLGGFVEDVGGRIVYKTNQLEQGVYDREELCEKIYPYMLCMEDFFSMGVQPYIWNKLMRRGLAYEHITAVDDRIRVGEDVAAAAPMLLAANRVVITDYCDYHYCMRESSMMQKHGSEEKEWEGLCILHKFLQKALQQHAKQYRLEYQLSHYTVGNMLTRTYDRIAEKDGDGTLWPFGYRLGENRKCIVYSAGNFGRQVYAYLQKYHPGCVVLWVDREYRKYQSMGLPVQGVADIIKEKNADILIAVLDIQISWAIRENLLQNGVCYEQIYSINITEDDVREMLDNVF
ncbi:MAG: glycosyltransferase family 2 protein [Lachnospiraceae bacterium]|nr:glycosyltransferase family 2 protein [Lachnospiraceae bacterium]